MTDLTPRSPHHRLSVRGHIGSLHLDLAADLTAPWTVLFGPSGCGKSTILRAICGLTPHLHVHAERLTANGTETLQASHTVIPPERRRIAYAPQHAVLFPHLTARQNVAFATAVRRNHPQSQTLVDEAMHLFALEPLANRLPAHLSGGERQRVSLARALAVPDARLLLLDEPFAGVDRALRDDLIPPLETWLLARNLPAISVTHDVDEACLLNAEVIRLEDGRNTAQGPANTVLATEIQRILNTLTSLGGVR